MMFEIFFFHFLKKPFFKSMNTIKVTIDRINNEITVWNNGKGIPIEEHKEEKILIPTMIFGHLLTGSNFDDNIKKVTGKNF